VGAGPLVRSEFTNPAAGLLALSRIDGRVRLLHRFVVVLCLLSAVFQHNHRVFLLLLANRQQSCVLLLPRNSPLELSLAATDVYCRRVWELFQEGYQQLNEAPVRGPLGAWL